MKPLLIPEQRREIYRKAKEIIPVKFEQYQRDRKNPFSGDAIFPFVCNLLVSLYSELYPSFELEGIKISAYFPEFYAQKPKGTSPIWWPCDEAGVQERLSALSLAIFEVNKICNWSDLPNNYE